MKRRSRARKAAKKSKAKAKSAHRKAFKRSARKPKPLRRASSRKKISPSSKSRHRRAARSPSSKKSSQSMMFEPLEQVTVACTNCGRQFNIVKLQGLSTEGMICQRCAVGEVEFPEG